MHAPDGGSDFLLIKLLARKSGFIPVFIEHTYHDLIPSVSSFQDILTVLIIIFLLFKVATKMSELAIGQAHFQIHNYNLVNFLPFMHLQPRFIVSAKPTPIVTYDTIAYPFGLQVWGFTFACIMTQFILLQVMQYVWCKISDGPNHIDYIYEGAYYGLT